MKTSWSLKNCEKTPGDIALTLVRVLPPETLLGASCEENRRDIALTLVGAPPPETLLGASCDEVTLVRVLPPETLLGASCEKTRGDIAGSRPRSYAFNQASCVPSIFSQLPVAILRVMIALAPLLCPAGAQEPAKTMNLEEFEHMAVANNPTMAQVDANLRMASGLARQAALYPNPTVGYYGDEIRGGYTGGGKQGGFISQTIVMGGKLGAARRVAELRTKEVKTGAEMQRLCILNNVRAVFYQVLAAQRMVAVKQNLAKLASDTVQTSRQLGNIGQSDRPDILQAEVEQQQANVGLRVAGHNLESIWRVLAAVAGKPDLPQTELDGSLDDIPDLTFDDSLATALRENPEVKLAQQSMERAEASLSQARRAPIPNLEVTGILAQSFEPLDTSRKPTGVQGGAQVGIELPIFNRNQGNIAASKAGIESARQNLARVNLHVRRDLTEMFRDYTAARLIAEQYKTEMLPRAEEAFKLYQSNYNNMAGAYPQVLISQRTLFQLEAEYVQALESVWQGALAIRGFGLMDGLSEPMAAKE